MSSYKSLSQQDEMLNELLIEIVKSLGGTIISNDKNSLLKSWLMALGG